MQGLLAMLLSKRQTLRKIILGLDNGGYVEAR
jgi:hypothetical protein